MKCRYCSHDDTKVVNSRLISAGSQIRRRRVCAECGERMTTVETVIHTLPRVIKQNGEREAFSELKLRSSIDRSLNKRAIASEDVDALLESLLHEICVTAEREITSRLLGEMVMTSLKSLDPVAYVRFASVYRSFTDVEEFRFAIENLATTTE